MAVSFLAGGNRNTLIKPLTCRKSLINFITCGVHLTTSVLHWDFFYDRFRQDSGLCRFWFRQVSLHTCIYYIYVCVFREGNDPCDSGHITYSQLKDKVCQFANVLKQCGKFYYLIRYKPECYAIYSLICLLGKTRPQRNVIRVRWRKYDLTWIKNM